MLDSIREYKFFLTIYITYYSFLARMLIIAFIIIEIHTADVARFSFGWLEIFKTKKKEVKERIVTKVIDERILLLHFNELSMICTIRTNRKIAVLETLKPLHLILCDSGLKLSKAANECELEESKRENQCYFHFCYVFSFFV